MIDHQKYFYKFNSTHRNIIMIPTNQQNSNNLKQQLINQHSKMQPETQAIDYQVGTLPLPTTSQLRIVLQAFQLPDFKQRIQCFTVNTSVQALELTFQYFDRSYSEQEYSALSPLFGNLKFLRIVDLGETPADNIEISKLVRGIGSPEIIEFYLKKQQVLKELQKQFHQQNSKFIAINKLRTPLILRNEQQQIPEQVKMLREVKSWGDSQINQLHLQHLSKIRQWRCLNLISVRSHKKLPWLQSIRDINFVHMRRLFFQRCSIDSLEPLAALSAPVLQFITLINNNITNVRQLRKMNSSSLRQLAMHTNKIQEANSLSQGNWPFYQSLYLDAHEDNKIVESLNFYAKLMSEKQFSFSSWSFYRIPELKIREKLKQKNLQFR